MEPTMDDRIRITLTEAELGQVVASLWICSDDVELYRRLHRRLDHHRQLHGKENDGRTH